MKRDYIRLAQWTCTLLALACTKPSMAPSAFASTVPQPPTADDSIGKSLPPSARSMDDLTEEQRVWIENRTASLIEKLGDDSYAVRERASIELQRIGMLAFEQLRLATLNPDPQIATSAHTLLQRINQEWGWDSDPIEIREVLGSYGRSSVIDRASLIDRIAKMKTDSSLAALCRICRYETHDSLSRHAAIMVLKSYGGAKVPGEGTSLQVIRQVIGSSRRVSCQWLIRFADWRQSNTFDAEWWTKTLAEERDVVRKTPQLAAPDDIIELNKWLCERLLELSRRSEAVAEANLMLQLVLNHSSVLVDLCHWGLEVDMPEWIFELQLRFPAQFESYAKLGYALAESYAKTSDQSRAEALALQAFQRGQADVTNIPVRIPERQDVASMLKQRGLLAWAEREYEIAWKNSDPLNRISIGIFFEYSYLLSDQEKFEMAAHVWESFADRLENEPLFRDQINVTYPEIFDEALPADAFLANFYYLSGMAAKQKADAKEAREWFSKAAEVHDDNSDVWIELYQLAGDSVEQTRVRQGASRMREMLRQRAGVAESQLMEGKADRYATHRDTLCRSLNELAWLMCNTGDNLDEALHAAQRACELSKNSASYLDTLACVHFRRGDFAEAVRLQELVVRMEPARTKFARTLKRYQEKLSP